MQPSTTQQLKLEDDHSSTTNVDQPIDQFPYLAKTPEGNTIFPDLNHTGEMEPVIHGIAATLDNFAIFLLRWTSKTLFNALPPADTTGDLVAEAAIHGNLEVYNQLVAANWIKCRKTYHVIVNDAGVRFSSRDPANFLGAATPIDDLIQVCERKQLSFEVIENAIKAGRPVGEIKRLFKECPRLVGTDALSGYMTEALHAGRTDVMEFIAGHRSFEREMKYSGAKAPEGAEDVDWFDLTDDDIRHLCRKGHTETLEWLGSYVHGMEEPVWRMSKLYLHGSCVCPDTRP